MNKILYQIIKYLYYILAFLLPFGAANIFNLGQYASRGDGGQDGFVPYVFALCSIMPLFDHKVRCQFVFVKKYISVLLPFLFFLVAAEFLYAGTASNWFYYVKLGIAISGFLLSSQTFIAYPNILKISLNIYSYVSLFIVVAFYLGLLENSYYFSNGRLWFLGINPNTYAFMLGFAALIFVNKVVNENQNKVFNIIVVLLLLFFILLTGSRGALIFVILSIAIIFRKKIFNLLIIAILVGLILSVFIDSLSQEITIFERLIDLKEGDSSRENLIMQTLFVFFKEPILGMGITGFQELMNLYFNEHKDSHNVLITNLAIGGVLSSLFYILFLFILLKDSLFKSKSTIFSFSLFIYMFLISMKTGHILTYSLMWYIYAVILSSNFLGRSYFVNSIHPHKY